MLWLYQIYWFYIGPMLALCHVRTIKFIQLLISANKFWQFQISMTFSSYLIILATIERFLITQRYIFFFNQAELIFIIIQISLPQVVSRQSRFPRLSDALFLRCSQGASSVWSRCEFVYLSLSTYSSTTIIILNFQVFHRFHQNYSPF